jgi:hypothetical protein
MGREKVSTRGKEIRSESSEEEVEEYEERSSGEEFGIHVHEKRSKPQAPPSRAQGRRRGHDGNPILKRKTTTVSARTILRRWWHSSMPHFMLIEMRMRCISLLVVSASKSQFMNLVIFSNLEVLPQPINSIVILCDFIMRMN